MPVKLNQKWSVQNISILAWVSCCISNFKSWIPIEIKNCSFTFLDSYLKSRKFLKKSWFLTAEILELFKILDSCLTIFLKIPNSWFLSRPLENHLALLWFVWCAKNVLGFWEEKNRAKVEIDSNKQLSIWWLSSSVANNRNNAHLVLKKCFFAQIFQLYWKRNREIFQL